MGQTYFSDMECRFFGRFLFKEGGDLSALEGEVARGFDLGDWILCSAACEADPGFWNFGTVS
jgi:hypothetical protein